MYAIEWQQIIKRMPLTLAFANKAVTTIWGGYLGTVVFPGTGHSGQSGIALIVAGVVMFSTADKEAT